MFPGQHGDDELREARDRQRDCGCAPRISHERRWAQLLYRRVKTMKRSAKYQTEEDGVVEMHNQRTSSILAAGEGGCVIAMASTGNSAWGLEHSRCFESSQQHSPRLESEVMALPDGSIGAVNIAYSSVINI